MLGYMNLSQQAAPVSGTFYGDVPFCDDFSNPRTDLGGPMVQDYQFNQVVQNDMNTGRGGYTVDSHFSGPSPSLMYESDYTSNWAQPIHGMVQRGPNPLINLSSDSHQQLTRKKDMGQDNSSTQYNPMVPMAPAPSNMGGYSDGPDEVEHFRGGRGGGGGGGGGRSGGGMRGGGMRGGGGGRRGGGGGAGFRRAAGAGALAGGALAARNRNRNHNGHHNPYGPWGPGPYGWAGYGPWMGGGGGGDWGTTYINIDSIPDAGAFYTTPIYNTYDPYGISNQTPDVYIPSQNDYQPPVERAIEKVVEKKMKDDKKDMMTNVLIIIVIVILILLLYKLVSKR